MKKRLIAIILAAVMAATLLPSVAFAADINVTTLAELQTAISGNAAQINITAGITVPSGTTVTIPFGTTATVKNGAVFTVENSGTLSFDQSWAPGEAARLAVESGGTYINDGITLFGTGTNTDAVFQVTEGDIFIGSAPPAGQSTWVYLEGSATANKDMTAANGVNYLVVDSDATLAIGTSLILDAGNELRGEIVVPSGVTFTVGSQGLSFDPSWAPGDAARLVVGAGGTYINDGTTLFGTGTNTEAVFQVTEGDIFIGSAPPEGQSTWVYLEGSAVANKDMTTACGVNYLVVDSDATLTIGTSLTLDAGSEIRGALTVSNTSILTIANGNDMYLTGTLTNNGTITNNAIISNEGGTISGSAIGGTGTVQDIYSVTVTNGTGSGSYAVGESVSITADSRSGYTFTNWTATGVALSSSNSATTTFTMPDHAVSVTANYSSNSSSDGSSTSTVTVTTSAVPVTPEPVTTGNVTTVTSKVTPVTNGNTAVASVSVEAMTNAIDAAIAAAEKANTTAGVEIKVDAPAAATEVKATLATTSFEKLTKKDASLTIATPVGTVTFDGAALASIGQGAGGASVTIGVAQVSRETLTTEQQTLAGDRPVIDLTVLSGEKQLSDFNGGSARVTVPYTLAAGEDADSLTVWYLTDDGTLTPIACTYKDGNLIFKTGHFSKYILAYFPYTDIKGGEWYYEDVAYAYTNRLMAGEGKNLFNPSGKTTRGMVATILWRLEGKPEGTAHSFTDVAAGTWYADAVGWAGANGIVSGYSGKLFGPEDSITREQLAAILMNYTKFKGYAMTTTGNPASFTDAETVSAWARNAMDWANTMKLINGVGNNRVDPQGLAQRAQLAAVLHNYVEFIVSN